MDPDRAARDARRTATRVAEAARRAADAAAAAVRRRARSAGAPAAAAALMSSNAAAKPCRGMSIARGGRAARARGGGCRERRFAHCRLSVADFCFNVQKFALAVNDTPYSLAERAAKPRAHASCYHTGVPRGGRSPRQKK